MPEDRLTLSERCVLLVLMAEATELTNAELGSRSGLRLEGKARRKLNDLGLVNSTLIGRAYVHELTERGTLRCTEELSGTRPERSGPAGGALYSVLAGLGRHLDDTEQVVADVFRPDIVARVRSAYDAISGGDGSPVGLAALRDRLGDTPRDDVDRALDRLAGQPGVHVRAEAEQKILTDDDRAAAVILGGTPRHLLTIEVSR